MNNDTLKVVLAFTKEAETQAKKYTDTVVAALPNGLVYKGAVDYYDYLPSADQQLGDTYTVRYKGNSGNVPDGTEYAWGEYDSVRQWIPLGPNITGKADKVSGATAGNLASLDANGNLIDSGKGLSDIIQVTDKGMPNGVPSLGPNGVIPNSQLPVSASAANMLLKIITTI